jgi:hypothetical protein
MPAAKTIPPQKPASSASNRATLLGFLMMCFIITGLVGLFASYAVPIPLARAIAREKTLDEAEAALSGPNPQAAIEALKARLDDSAPALIPLPPDPKAAIAKERIEMRARFLEEEEGNSTRIHWLIVIVTVMSAVFGTAITGFGRKA